MAKPKNTAEYFDIKSLFLRYFSKWYIFVISVIICGGLAFLYTRVKKPVYGVRASVVIATESNSPLTGAFGSLSNLFGSGPYIDDEIFVISSHSVYKDVAKDLGLDQTHFVKKGFLNTVIEFEDYPVELVVPAEMPDTLRKNITFKLKADEKGKVDLSVKIGKETLSKLKDASFPITLDTDYGKFVLNKTKYYPEGEDCSTTIVLRSYDSAAEILSQSVVSEMANRKSNVINLLYDTPYPAFGVEVLNTVIEEYNKRGLLEKNIQGIKTAEFIDSRLALLSSDLNEAETDIQKYKETNGFVDLEVEAGYQTKKKGEVEEKLIEAETKAEILRMINDFIANPANANSLVPMTSDNDGLKTAISAYNELVLKRMDVAANARPNNSSLRLLDDQIAAMRANIITSISKAYDTQVITVNELKAAIRNADSKLGNIPTQEKAFRDLLRQQTIKQELYIFLLQKHEETSMLLANTTPKGTVVDEGYILTEPLSMNPKMIWIIGILIGLLLPPLLFWLKDFFNDKFENVSGVKKLTDTPVLGEICIDKSGNSMVVAASDTSPTTELFRLLRSNLQFILNDINDKVVLVTSTSSGEGKSFISINLAASLALVENKRVLLVGFDIRKPRLSSYLNINPQFGLTQYLSSNSIKLEQIIVQSPDIPSLDIIIAGPVPPNPSELIQSKRVDEFFAEVRKKYDYIIVDSAPVGMVSDSFALDRISDATVYVVRANHTTERDINYINDIYDQGRLKKLSLVVNGTATKRGYGYGYHHDSKIENR